MNNINTFKDMEQREEWSGFGYLGGRRNALADGKIEQVAAADLAVIEFTRGCGWTNDELFEWANSKYGRWFADAAFDVAGEVNLDLVVKIPW